MAEAERLRLMERLQSRVISQGQAAKELGVTVRQVKRIWRRFRTDGSKGLISRRRGRPSNRRLSEELRREAIELVKERYADFGPTLAREQLIERHSLEISVESLRQLMIAAGIWQTRSQRAKLHARRERRPRFGELIQIDGSIHHWFEDRGPKCTLIVFVDDATSQITYAWFEPAETTHAYADGLRHHLTRFGRPLALYSDRHSVFRPTRSDSAVESQTQLGRMLQTLRIDHIAALTAQAKGRVERANKTLQDRLVKALRLEGISSMDEANKFLPEFIKRYNQRFAVTPALREDAHRPVMHTAQQLHDLLCLHEERKLSESLSFQMDGKIYQVLSDARGRRLRHAHVLILTARKGYVRLRHGKQDLPYRVIVEQPKFIDVADRAELDRRLDAFPASTRPRTRARPEARP